MKICVFKVFVSNQLVNGSIIIKDFFETNFVANRNFDSNLTEKHYDTCKNASISRNFANVLLEISVGNKIIIFEKFGS